VAIINETLARQYFPHADPLGQRIVTAFDGNNGREIIGVIRDIHDRGLSTTSPPTVYVPYRQMALAYGGVVARTNTAPESALAEIRRRVAEADPNIALTHLTTIKDRVSKTLDAPRFYTLIALACAAMAVLFVTFGLYGVISYNVAAHFRDRDSYGTRRPARGYPARRAAAGVGTLLHRCSDRHSVIARRNATATDALV
jgi:hypothetical protein